MTALQIHGMKELLRIAAYPRRGTFEEQIDIQWLADRITEQFTLSQLEDHDQ